jgi:UV excision repair protein RAD23
VKERIEAEHKLEAALMKLIAYGKVMEDDAKTLKDYSIKEGDFLVVMISKAKPPAKNKPEDQKQEQTST